MDIYIHWVHLIKKLDSSHREGENKLEGMRIISSMSQCRSSREQRRKFYQMEQLCTFSPAAHQPRNPQTPCSTTSTRKRRGRKQGLKVKQSGHSPSHFCSDKPTSSWTSMVMGLTQPHAGCTEILSGRHMWLCGCWPLPQRVRGEFSTCSGHRDLAWGAAKAGRRGASDVTQPFGSSSCLLYIHTEPEEWLAF